MVGNWATWKLGQKRIKLSDKELKYPKWQSEFEEAIVEFDPAKLTEKIKQFELAVFVRVQELACNSDHHDEKQAMADALATIRDVKRDKLSHPDWKKYETS